MKRNGIISVVLSISCAILLTILFHFPLELVGAESAFLTQSSEVKEKRSEGAVRSRSSTSSPAAASNGCTYTVSPGQQTFTAVGGSQTITVTTQAGCFWGAVQSEPWIAITGNPGGEGSGSITYSVNQNSTTTPRIGSILVAGKNVLVFQADGANCVPTSLTIPQSANGSLSLSDCRSLVDQNAFSDYFTFTAQAGQRIAVSETSQAYDTYLLLYGPNRSIIDVNDDTATGNSNSRIPMGSGYVVLPFTGTYLIEASSYGANETGSYSISLEADPSGTSCSYAVTPSIKTFPAAGGTGSAALTTGGSCGWTANMLSFSSDQWLQITGSATGTGSGTVGYQAAGNASQGYRHGRLAIGGQYVLMVQSGTGGECPVTSIPLPQNVNGSWAVGDCANGNGQFTDLYAFQGQAGQAIAMSLNTSSTLTSLTFFGPDGWFIAGREGNGNLALPGSGGPVILPFTGTYLVEVSAGSQGSYSFNLSLVVPSPPCEYAISPTSQSFTSAGGNGSVTVTATSGCNWGVTNSIPWVTITSPQSGTGNGTVNYTVAVNTGAQRSGTMTIAGKVFTVTQSGSGGPPPFTVLAHKMAGPPDPNSCTAPVAKYNFSATDTYAYQWASFSGVQAGDVVKWEFYQPNGSLFTSTQTNFTVSGNTCDWAWGRLQIAGTSAASLTGDWQVRVLYNNAQIFTETFRITAGANTCPTVSGRNPSSGPVGSSVVITGTNFTNVTAVKFTNNVTAQFTINSDTQITATVPSGAVNGPITIGKSGCLDVQSDIFNITTTPPGDVTVPSGYTTSPFTVGGSPGSYGFPTSITYSAAGSFGNYIYFGDSLTTGGTGKIYRIGSDMFLSTFASGITGPISLAIDPSGAFGGDLFVVNDLIYGSDLPGPGNLTIGDDSIKRVKPDGTISGFGVSGVSLAGEATIVFGRGGAFGTDLYLNNVVPTEVARIQPNGTGTRLAAITNGSISGPRGMAFGPGGAFGTNLYVGNATANQILRVDSSGNVTTFVTGIPGIVRLAFDLSGTFGGDLFASSFVPDTPGGYIATSAKGKIYRVKSDGTFQVFAEGLYFSTLFGADFTFGFNGDMFVAEDGRKRILRITSPNAPACPSVSQIAPTSGAVGSNVTITGTNFTGLTSVKFTSNVAATIVSNTGTVLTVTVPAGAVTGPITISKAGCSDAVTPTFTIGGGGTDCLTADYQFQNTRNSSFGTAPALVDLGTNSFTTATVDGSSRTVLRFPNNNGVAMSPAVPNGQVYSVAMLFAFDEVNGYRRILDFKNGTTDNGLYVYSGTIGFWGPGKWSTAAPITANTYVQVVVTRDASKNLRVYVNGVEHLSFVDSGDAGALDANNKFRFFQDNTQGSYTTEASAGYAARIRVYDCALSATQVSGLDRLPTGGTCTFILSKSNQSFAANGGTDTVDVATQGGCTWSVTNTANWISITEGQNGSGNGAVKYTVAANNIATPRTAVLTIAGQQFTVNQAGLGSPCANATNLLTNPGAEAPITQQGQIPGWTLTSNFSTELYGTGGFPSATEGQRINGGTRLFTGGPSNALSSAAQTVSVSSDAAAIDEGQRVALLRGELGSFSLGDSATLKAEFLNGTNGVLSEVVIGPVATGTNEFQLKETSAVVPVGTRAVRVTMISIRTEGSYNDGYFDNLFLGLCTGEQQPTGGDCVTPPSGIVGWWPGDGNAADLQGANPGTLKDGTTFGNGKVGRAFSFDGTDDAVKTNLDVQGSALTTTTWEAWVYPTRINVGRQQVFSIDDGGYDRSVLIEAGTGKWMVFVGGTNWLVTDVTLNEWQHLAVVFSTTDVEFYKNGVRFSYGSAPGSSPTGQKLWIGGSPGYGEYFQGLIDEATVYNRTLSANEIQGIYNAGAAGKCKPAVIGCPTVNEITPKSAAVGGSVTIIGAGLRSGVSVKFPGNLASYISGASDMQLTVIIPPGAVTGPLTLSKPGCPDMATETLTIASCSYDITPKLVSLPAAGSSGLVTVTTANTCSWTATNPPAWATISAGATGTGRGTVTITVQPNTSPNPREGTVTIAGQTIAIKQAGTVFTDCVNAPSGLVAWYGGDGNAHDLVAGRNGQLKNGATFATGRVGQAFNLDGVDDYVEVAHSPELDPTAEATMEAWVNLAETPSRDHKMDIMSKTAPGRGLGLSATTDDRFYFYVGSGWGVRSTTIIQKNQWYHLAATYVANQEIRLYVNGRLETTQRINEIRLQHSNPLMIGASPGLPNDRFRGLIDEASLYNRALSAAEIEAIHLAGGAGKCKPGGCQYSLSKTSQSFPVGGGQDSFTVTTQAGCPWTVSPSEAWIAVTSSSNGSGNTTVTYTVAANTGALARTGFIRVNDAVLAITQAGTTVCTYTISPESKSYGPQEYPQEAVQVSTQPGCKWTFTNPVPWIYVHSSVENPAQGTGAYGYLVEANKSGIARTGTLTIAGKTLTITQSANSIGCQTPAFAPAQTIPAAGVPFAIEAADFNGDGRPDLAVVNLTPASVSIFLNNGGTTLTGPTNFPVGNNPFALTVADFNLDNKLDLAVANSESNNVSILLGDGMGGFGAASNITVGSAPSAIDAGDFNLDGKPDLIVANLNSGYASVLLGDGSGGFGSPLSLSTGVGARAVLVADFNKDNRADVAVANREQNVLSIFYSNGDGTFLPGSSYATGTEPLWLATADLNLDGNPDLISADRLSDSLTVLLGRADLNGFRKGGSYAVEGGPRSIAVGDFNLDGAPDLAVTSFTTNSLVVLLGNSGGGFAAPVKLSTGAGPTAATVTDFNGDGRPDAVTANLNGTNLSLLVDICAAPPRGPNLELAPAILNFGDVTLGQSKELTVTARNTGTGTLTVSALTSSNPRFTVVSPATPFNLAAGAQQAVTVRFTPTTTNPEKGGLTFNSNDPNKVRLRVSLLGGAAACTFALSSKEFSFAATGGTDAVSVATQGDCEWAATTTDPWIKITLGNVGRGNGVVRFTIDPNTAASPRAGTMTIAGQSVTVRQAGASACTYTLTPPNQSFTANGGNGTIAIATQAGCDWAATPSVPWISITSEKSGFGSGTISFAVEANAGALARTGVIPIRDRNFTVNQEGAGGGTGGCEASSLGAPTQINGGSNPVRVTTADLNLDNKTDLVVANLNAGNVAVLLGDGVGGFATPRLLESAKNTIFAFAKDFNQDGKPDIAAVNQGANNIAIFLGDGSGGFGPATLHGVGSSPVSMAEGDLNRDGSIDLAVTNLSSGNVSILLGDGQGGFAAARNIAVGSNPAAVATGDLNRDGQLDLIVTIASTSSVTILYGSGDGNFGNPVSYPVGNYPGGLAVADFNGDDRPDLAVSNLNSNHVSVLLAGGDGFNAAVNYPVGAKPLGLAIGDFNLDGKADLITSNVGDGKVSILYGDGNGVFSTAFNFAAGDGPTSVAVADFNGDRKADAITANLNSKNLTLLLNGCTAGVQGANLVVEPASLDFGAVSVGSSKELPLTLRNTGAKAARVNSLEINNPRFKIVTPAPPFDLAAGGQQIVTTRFTPDAASAQTAVLTINSNDPNKPKLEVMLKGSGAGGCTFTINPSSRVIGPNAATGSFAIETQPGCAWKAISNDPRLTITSNDSGTGAGSVNYSVPALPYPFGAYPMTISVGGLSFYLIQMPNSNPCGVTSLTIPQTINGQLATSDCRGQTPENNSPSLSDYYDFYSITVTAGQQIAITGNSTAIDPALDLRGPDGKQVASDGDGGGGKNARIPASTGFITLSQAGTYLIVLSGGYQQTGSYTLSVTAPGGCAYRLSSNGQAFGAPGGPGRVTIDTQAACQWSAESNVNWIVYNLDRSGTGPATIDFTVLPNAGTTPRQGTLTIGGQAFTITQESAAACTYTLSTTNQTVVAEGGPGVVSVTTQAGCAWETKSNNEDWISITSALKETGNGTVSFNVAPNPNKESRSGTLTIAGSTLAITQPGTLLTDRVVSIANGNGAPGATVSVAVELIAQGDENAFGFSLNFDPAILSNPQIAKGSDAASATLNFNLTQAGQGRIGIGLALGSGQTFPAGKRQLVVVTFTIFANATATTTAIDFGDQPVPRELVNVNVATLPATYTAGTVTITQGYEADVSPRPNGNNNGRVSIADWVQLARLASGADTPPTGGEFQRADCAPRDSAGDGRIGVSDIVQAGRYAIGIDPVARAGGPAGSVQSTLAALGLMALQVDTNRVIRIVESPLARHGNATVAIEIDAQGDENALGFSLNFDTAQLTFVTVTVGNAIDGATLSINSSQTAQGRVGMVIALPAGQTIPAGTRQIILVTFAVKGDSNETATTISFGDQPVPREVVNDNASILPAVWKAASVKLVRVVGVASAASYSLTALTMECIAAAFGADLASTTQGAETTPLPTTLAGTSIKITDSAGATRLAPLFFVSPLQVNFQIPPGTAPGLAEVTVTSGTGAVSSGTLPVDTVAPSIFTANAEGKGLASAEIFRLKANGSYTIEQTKQFDPGVGRWVPIAIDMGPESDQVFLILYGTGLRYRSNLSNVSVRIGGLDCQVTYAGVQPDYVGLDQMNIRIPRNLIGRGEVEIVVTVDNKVANTVTATIK